MSNEFVKAGVRLAVASALLVSCGGDAVKVPLADNPTEEAPSNAKPTVEVLSDTNTNSEEMTLAKQLCTKNVPGNTGVDILKVNTPIAGEAFAYVFCYTKEETIVEAYLGVNEQSLIHSPAILNTVTKDGQLVEKSIGIMVEDVEGRDVYQPIVQEKNGDVSVYSLAGLPTLPKQEEKNTIKEFLTGLFEVGVVYAEPLDTATVTATATREATPTATIPATREATATVPAVTQTPVMETVVVESPTATPELKEMTEQEIYDAGIEKSRKEGWLNLYETSKEVDGAEVSFEGEYDGLKIPFTIGADRTFNQVLSLGEKIDSISVLSDKQDHLNAMAEFYLRMCHYQYTQVQGIQQVTFEQYVAMLKQPGDAGSFPQAVVRGDGTVEDRYKEELRMFNPREGIKSVAHRGSLPVSTGTGGVVGMVTYLDKGKLVSVRLGTIVDGEDDRTRVSDNIADLWFYDAVMKQLAVDPKAMVANEYAKKRFVYPSVVVKIRDSFLFKPENAVPGGYIIDPSFKITRK